ncbi:TonB-dependent receptor [Neolewinella agarilytica]|uniref:TonB-dependent receptor n=1 Tax=Neolewinella agarilytica TaxID=478744 RepID=UPI002355DE1A|nr:TonB-dependent receptor [Neolewinella agarilytica]
MDIRFYFLVCLLTIGRGLMAQQLSDCPYAIQGRVYDAASKEPLAFVSVQLDGNGEGAVTDEAGKFDIENLCEQEYNLIFSFLGYKTVTHHHDFHHPALEIYLAPDEYLLESVVVEASSLQSGIASITSNRLSGKELEAVSSGSFGDAVSEITGVGTLKTGQNIVKPIIHGLHSNRVLLINNGLRHEFQNWGEDHAPEIDPSLIDNIEVVKGAATVRFGPDALGGVILANPAKVELNTPLAGKVRLHGQSNGRAGEGTVELSKGFKWWSLQGGGSYVKQGDLQAAEYLLTNTGKEESSYYGELRVHPNAKLDIEASYSHFEQELGILSGSVFGNLDDLRQALVVDTPLYTMPFSYDINQPRQSVQHDLLKGSIRYIGKNQSLFVQYGHQLNRRQEFGVRRGDAPNIDLELLTESVDLDWNHPDLGSLSGKLGAQWLKKANDNQAGTNTVPFIPNYDEQRLGIYLIESLALGKGTLEAGIRYDQLESDITGREPDNTIYRNTILYRNVSGTLGWEHPVGKNGSFRSNFGTAWRAPDVAELYRFGQHNFFIEYGLWRYTINEDSDFVTTREGILDQADREVPSEKGYKWINTYRLDKDKLSLEFTGYVNYINNFIYSKPAGITRTARGSFVFFIYDQTDALLWGVDASSRLTHSPRFSSEAKGSFLWSKQLSPADFFANQPAPQLTYQLDYEPNISWLAESKLQLRFDYTFQQFQHPRIITVEDFLFAAQQGINRFSENALDFDLLPPPPAYLLTHASWTSRWKKLQLRLEVRNLFNVSYRNYTDRMRYFADDLGRNFMTTITIHI